MSATNGSSASSGEDEPTPAAVLQSMTLLATLSTATEVREAVAERRAGRDPSAQMPPGFAAARLRKASHSLMDVLMQLVLGRVPLEAKQEGELVQAVRHFDLLMKLRQVERALQDMHQHLLSLYPDVSEALVEEARLVQEQVQSLMEEPSSDSDGPILSDVLERAIAFVVWTRHEV